MANGLYEAPKSNLGALAELYMAGQAQVQKIRGEVRAQRAQESQNLTDMIEKISLTGLQDADKMYNEGAIKLRNVISQAQQDNANGLITRQEATRIANNAISQADLLVNSTELIGNKYEELKKEVQNGTKSQADLDIFENSYFGNVNAIGGNSVKTLEYGPKGLAFQRAYTFYNPLTKTNQTAVVSVPLSEGIDPTSQGIAGYDGDDWANSVKKRLTAMAPPVQLPGAGNAVGGYQFNTWVQNPQNDPQVIQGIELMINKFTDAELIGVLYDGMSGRATYSPNYDGNTPQELDTMKYKFPNGESLFQEFDSQGNLVDIDFNSTNDGDLFRIEHEIDGQLKISDRQKQMVKAFLRKKALLALGIDYDNRFGRKTKGRTSTSTVSSGPFTSYSIKGGASGTQGTNLAINVLDNLGIYENNTITYLNRGAGLTDERVTDMSTAIQNSWSNYLNQTSADLSNIDQAQSDFYRTAGIVPNTLGRDTGKGFEMRLFGHSDVNLSEVFIGETGSKPSDLNLKSIHGNKLTSIDSFGFIKSASYDETDNEGNKTEVPARYTIVFEGATEVGEEKNPNAGSGTTSYSSKKVTDVFGYASRKETEKLYSKLKGQYTLFADEADNGGVDKYYKAGVANGVNDPYAYAIYSIMNKIQP